MSISKFLKIFAATGIILSGGVPAIAAPGLTTAGYISQINARDVGYDFIVPGVSNPMGCTNAGYFRLAPSVSSYNSIVANLILAFSSGKRVQMYTAQCDTDGASLILSALVL